MCEQDPDVTRWGLHHLFEDLSISSYCGTATQNDVNSYDDQFIRDGNVSTNHTAVENDEVIAHALQEELSHVAVAEASGYPHADPEHLQASVLAQDWFGSPMTNLCSGNESVPEGAEDMGPPSSCSSPGDKLYDGDVIPLELAEEFSSLDGEVGKRLTHVVPVPHVPKINGEIPSVDEATSDHQRLLDRLRLYDLVELKVQGDGNCQFRALSDQFYRSTEHHGFVRQQVVNQLKSHREIYEGYVPMAYDDYLKKMAKSGEWGDHVTLQAAADTYGVKIFVLTSFKDTCYIEILPNDEKSKRTFGLRCIIIQSIQKELERALLHLGKGCCTLGDAFYAHIYGVKIFVLTSFKDTCYIEILPNDEKSKRIIFLSFWAEVHYNSIYPEGDMPTLETKKKKRWWHFGNKH